MIRSFLRACGAALGLRGAPAPEPTREPDPTREQPRATPGWERGFHGTMVRRPVTDVRRYEEPPPEFLSGDDLAEAEQEEAEQEECAADLLGPLGRRSAEVVVEQALWPGMPRSWPCRCGGRPFEGKTCPRCGRTEAEGRA